MQIVIDQIRKSSINKNSIVISSTEKKNSNLLQILFHKQKRVYFSNKHVPKISYSTFFLRFIFHPSLFFKSNTHKTRRLVAKRSRKARKFRGDPSFLLFFEKFLDFDFSKIPQNCLSNIFSPRAMNRGRREKGK